MKRIFYFALVIAILVAAGLFVLPFLVSGEKVSQRLNARIVELTDNKLTYKGQPKFSLNPFWGVELFDVALRSNKSQSDAEPLLHIEELKFNLKVLPLLFGKVRLSGFKLVRPKFNIAVDENGSINWIKRAIAKDANPDPTIASSVQLGQFDIVDGIVITTLRGQSEPVRISNLNAQISWPNIASAWEISGNGVWSGESFEFFNITDDPLALFSSGSSEVEFQVDSPALTVSFDGMANTASSIQLRGDSNIDIPSLPRLIELMDGANTITKSPVGKVHLDGVMTANTHEISFNEANVNLDDNAATGNIQFYRRGEKRAKISGTLAFASLNANPFVEMLTVGYQQTQPGEKSASLTALDLDVRFSTQTYQLGSNSFGTMAATALVSGDDWTFDIGEAEFFDGMVIGTIASKSTDEHDEIELKGVINNVSLENIAQKWHGGDIFAAGIANITFDFKARDKSALSDFRKFSGGMDISMTDSQLEGIDILKSIPALDENNGFVTFDEIKGSTPLGKLTLELLVHNGVGWITKGTAQNSSNEIQLSGKGDMLHGGLAIYLDIRDLSESGTTSPQARVFVGGTVRNPLVTRSPLPLNRPDERAPTDG